MNAATDREEALNDEGTGEGAAVEDRGRGGVLCGGLSSVGSRDRRKHVE